jgi:hypothetical protein
MIERLWMIASGILLALAAFFVWRNNLSAAFVTAAVGACAWFLSYRTELKKKIEDDESNTDDDIYEDETDS